MPLWFDSYWRISRLHSCTSLSVWTAILSKMEATNENDEMEMMLGFSFVDNQNFVPGLDAIFPSLFSSSSSISSMARIKIHLHALVCSPAWWRIWCWYIIFVRPLISNQGELRLPLNQSAPCSSPFPSSHSTMYIINPKYRGIVLITSKRKESIVWLLQ